MTLKLVHDHAALRTWRGVARRARGVSLFIKVLFPGCVECSTVPILEQPGEPPEMGTQGVASGLEARASASPKPPSAPYLLRYDGTAAERRYR